jgi:hypothetical protein
METHNVQVTNNKVNSFTPSAFSCCGQQKQEEIARNENFRNENFSKYICSASHSD